MQGDRVKLGFVAPAEVPIHRTETRRAMTTLPDYAGLRRRYLTAIPLNLLAHPTL